MGRIMAIDFGMKRCGIAVTDPMRIVVTGLDTVSPQALISFIANYSQKETLDIIVFGIPYRADGSLSPVASEIKKMMDKVHATFPNIELDGIDESFTSAQAVQTMIQVGVPKKKRRIKELTDKVSATLILRNYLDEKGI